MKEIYYHGAIFTGDGAEAGAMAVEHGPHYRGGEYGGSDGTGDGRRGSDIP